MTCSCAARAAEDGPGPAADAAAAAAAAGAAGGCGGATAPDGSLARLGWLEGSAAAVDACRQAATPCINNPAYRSCLSSNMPPPPRTMAGGCLPPPFTTLSAVRRCLPTAATVHAMARSCWLAGPHLRLGWRQLMQLQDVVAAGQAGRHCGWLAHPVRRCAGVRGHKWRRGRQGAGVAGRGDGHACHAHCQRLVLQARAGISQHSVAWTVPGPPPALLEQLPRQGRGEGCVGAAAPAPPRACLQGFRVQGMNLTPCALNPAPLRACLHGVKLLVGQVAIPHLVASQAARHAGAGAHGSRAGGACISGPSARHGTAPLAAPGNAALMVAPARHAGTPQARHSTARSAAPADAQRRWQCIICTHGICY